MYITLCGQLLDSKGRPFTDSSLMFHIRRCKDCHDLRANDRKGNIPIAWNLKGISTVGMWPTDELLSIDVGI